MTAAAEFPQKSWLDGKAHTAKADDPSELAARLYAWAAEHDRTVHVTVDADSVTLRFDQ